MRVEQTQEEMLERLADIYSIKNNKFFIKKMAEFYTERLEGTCQMTPELLRTHIEKYLADGIEYVKMKYKLEEYSEKSVV